jgi:hypothetical protein
MDCGTWRKPAKCTEVFDHGYVQLLYLSAPAGAYQFDISTIRPRQVVVIGSLKELMYNGEINEEKCSASSYSGQQDVDILTFDELFERSRFIVERHEV